MVVFYLGLATALAAVLLSLLLGPRRTKPSLPRPPSPPEHWLFGHMLQLPNVAAPGVAHIDLLFEKWARELGPVFSINAVPFFLPRIIVCADPGLNRHVCVTKNYRRSPTYARILPVIGKESMLVAEGEDWARKRRAFNPGFAPDFLRGVMDTVFAPLRELLSACAAAADDGEPLRLHTAAIDFTVDVIARVAFGEEWKKSRATTTGRLPTHEAMRQLLEECAMNNLNPLREAWPATRWRMQRLERVVNEDMDAVVHARLAAVNADDAKSKDIVSLALRHALRSSPAGADAALVDDVRAQLKSFYFAGHETTSTTIAWAIWLLAQHPEALSRVRDEASEHLGFKAGSAATAPTYAALGECQFTEAVLKETLRLYPPAATARFVTDPDDEYNGMAIGGCIVYVCQRSLHRLPAVWAEPDEFRPERFLTSRDTLRKGSAPDGVDQFAYVPFSTGPKDCIGKYFAILEGKLAIAALAADFDFSVVNPHETIAYRVTQRPMDGCQVRVQHRHRPG